MLAQRALHAVGCLMSYGCSLCIIPYGWDSADFKLIRANRFQNTIFNVNSFCVFLNYSFLTFRCISTINDEMPNRVRMMNIVWVVAFGLASSSTIQFYKTRNEIMAFANALFESMDVTGRKLAKESRYRKKGGRSVMKQTGNATYSLVNDLIQPEAKNSHLKVFRKLKYPKILEARKDADRSNLEMKESMESTSVTIGFESSKVPRTHLLNKRRKYLALRLARLAQYSFNILGYKVSPNPESAEPFTQYEATNIHLQVSGNPNPAAEKMSSNWISRTVLISSFMLYTNGPAHAMVLWYGPCVPTYVSSIIHNCASVLDMPLSMLEATPYVFWEFYIIGSVLAVWSFNWTMIFLGWLWIKDTLKNARETTEVDYTNQQYRRCQILATFLNDGFGFYLQAFPSVLFTMAGMMLFASIRYTQLPLNLYIVFPACGVRCLFEAVTALAAAGMLHKESIHYLACMEKRIDSMQKCSDRKYRRVFHKSCKALICAAGSMYTFESSIVLASLYHCTQLTFNMLVTYD